MKMVSLLQENLPPEREMFVWDVPFGMSDPSDPSWRCYSSMIDERLIKNDRALNGGFQSGSTDSNHGEGHAVTYICQACSIKPHGSAWNVVLCSNISDLYH